jgi:hypothetical protein
MPLYLVEMAIMAHKLDPQYYKKATKDEKKIMQLHARDLLLNRILEEYTEAVKVYDDPSEIPPNGDGSQNIISESSKNETVL